jgi:hypothetical protein
LKSPNLFLFKAKSLPLNKVTMRYSIIAASLLASTATAWRLPDFDWSNQGWRPITSSAVATFAPSKTAVASATHVATTVVASSTPTTKVVAEAAPTAVAASGLTTDEQAALDAHNDARAVVGTADLTWDASLAAEALAYAKTLASSGTFQHSGVSGEGENLYMQSGSTSPLANAVKSFVSEKSLYSGQAISSTNYQSFGHYSKCLLLHANENLTNSETAQVVWKDTTKVGMGVAKGSTGTYVVARYKTPGNFIGEKAY